MADPRIRTIKIKSGVVKRLAKEKTVYEREAEQQKARVEKFKADKKDEYEVRKQEEVLQEALMMVPDCQRRLAKAFDDLKGILDTEHDLKETEDYINAARILEEAKIQLAPPGELHMSHALIMSYFNYQFNNFNPHPSTELYSSIGFSGHSSLQLNTSDLQSVYNKSNDELWVESWLQQNNIYQALPKLNKIETTGPKIRLYEAKNSLTDCLILLRKLETIRQDLADNVETMTTGVWKQKTIEIGAIKDEFTKLMGKFDSPRVIKHLKKIINKRKKKRCNIKKQKEFKQQQNSAKTEACKKLHKDIDQWLASKKEDTEKAKMEEEMKKDADCVLSEVNKKKSDARKQLSLICALVKLRTVRENVYQHRGEKTSLEDRQAFNIATEKLVKLWESSLKSYSTEEHGLKLMIEKNANEDSKAARLAKERNLLEDWQQVFFGTNIFDSNNPTYWALTAAERDMETFIAIRKSWDTFLVPPGNEMGSKIPIGWVLPDAHANEAWNKYLER